jgi:hypothetical protein
MRIFLVKGKYDIIDMNASLAASAWHPIGNKAAKAAALEAGSTD